MIDRKDTCLLADIGGTHARFALAGRGGRCPDEAELDIPVRDYADLPGLVRSAARHFSLDDFSAIDLVVALAGPVESGRASITNLGWGVDEASLREEFGFRNIALLNDLEAAALAVASGLGTEQQIIQPGRGHIDRRHALVSVGTGLGVAYWQGHGRLARVEATEAGHSGFAPEDAWQRDWLAALQRRHGRVSWERVLSGPGLAALEAWLRGSTEPDDPDDVSQRAVAGDAVAGMAVRALSRMLGAFAGDLVLTGPAAGGIWLAGGVVNGLGSCFDNWAFMQGFRAKGRMSGLLQQVTVIRVGSPALGLR
ncbi:MAG: ROK family protein, partial [Gammaproteobacteria bacterium]